MILDGHIHILADDPGDREAFRHGMASSGMGGGLLISLPPASFFHAGRITAAGARLDNLWGWLQAAPGLYPCFWIDPLEDDALAQVSQAAARGVKAFKVICNRYYPGDARALEVFRAITAVQRPILFHSGILWDGAPTAKYNRPGEFEALLEVPGLVFSLAHISWPWCDELIAVYGKFLNALAIRPGGAPEMFVDTTPGTPPIYRREALTKLFTVGYEVGWNVIFGTDCVVHRYHAAWVKEWVARDNAIFAELKLPAAVTDGIYGGNLQRFLGLSATGIRAKPVLPAE